MKTHFKLVQIALALTLACIFSTSAFSETDASTETPSLPPMQSQGQTGYITGGIGQDESKAILKARSSWPLMLELAQVAADGAAYIADVKITIRDASGDTMLDITTEGPFLLAKLPPGKYSLDAAYESKTLHRDLHIQEGRNTKVTLLWPSDADK